MKNKKESELDKTDIKDEDTKESKSQSYIMEITEEWKRKKSKKDEIDEEIRKMEEWRGYMPQPSEGHKDKS